MFCSPIGTTQSLDGAGIFVSAIAAKSFDTSSRESVFEPRRRNAAKRLRQKLKERRRLRFARHFEEFPQLDAVRVRFDFDRFRRKFADRRGVVRFVPVWVDEVEGRVRVRERRLFEVFVDAAATAMVFRLQLDRYPGSARDVDPIEFAVAQNLPAFVVGGNRFAGAVAVEDFRFVRFRVDADDEIRRRFARREFRDDFERFSGRQQAVHPGRADPDPLLTAAHSEAVEFRAVKKFPVNQRNLLRQDTGAVVLHRNAVRVFANPFDARPNFRERSGLFASVERVVDRFFDRR